MERTIETFYSHTRKKVKTKLLTESSHYLSIYLPIHPSVHPSNNLSIHSTIYICIYPSSSTLCINYLLSIIYPPTKLLPTYQIINHLFIIYLPIIYLSVYCLSIYPSLLNTQKAYQTSWFFSSPHIPYTIYYEVSLALSVFCLATAAMVAQTALSSHSYTTVLVCLLLLPLMLPSLLICSHCRWNDFWQKHISAERPPKPSH